MPWTSAGAEAIIARAANNDSIPHESHPTCHHLHMKARDRRNLRAITDWAQAQAQAAGMQEAHQLRERLSRGDGCPPSSRRDRPSARRNRPPRDRGRVLPLHAAGSPIPCSPVDVRDGISGGHDRCLDRKAIRRRGRQARGCPARSSGRTTMAYQGLPENCPHRPADDHTFLFTPRANVVLARRADGNHAKHDAGSLGTYLLGHSGGPIARRESASAVGGLHLVHLPDILSATRPGPRRHCRRVQQSPSTMMPLSG